MESRIEYHYTIRYRDKIRGKWQNSRYKMSESTAAERYGDTEWEIRCAIQWLSFSRRSRDVKSPAGTKKRLQAAFGLLI
jgi:hypothetical protein